MIQQDDFVLVQHVLPVGVVITILAEQMVEIALLLVTTEIQTDADSVLEGTLVW